MDTPEFVVWALEYTCPIRGFQNGCDPERTERQLRAARAINDARREGRIYEGLCVDPPDGFRISEALAIYGGLAAVEQACRDCPANAVERIAAGSLAGCYGILPLPLDEPAVHATVDEAMADGSLSSTRPRWYGLWNDSPLGRNQQLRLLDVLAAVAFPDVMRTAVAELEAGLRTAIDANLPLHVALYPRGRVEGTSWKLVPHCPRCKAPWSDSRSRQCAVCDYTGAPAPDKKRKARGRRPYFPLSMLLGEQGAADFLLRFAAYRARQESTDPEQSRLAPKPPGSLPAG